MDEQERPPESGQPLSGLEWKAQIEVWCAELGFDAVGFAPAEEPPRSRERLEEWLDLGYHASMGWMARDPARRCDPETILPGARSVIVVALQYLAATPVPAEPGLPKISRYAQGEDYHRVVGDKLHSLRDQILRAFPGLESRIACDTSPIMDKAFAAAGGLGWIGKNSCLLHPKLGSWFFLGEIFVNLEIPSDEAVSDLCGTCTRCIDACPTDALVEPYVLDANRCIAYRNIEHRGEMPADWPDELGDWLVGCDICQDVCPWNRKAPLGTEPRLQPNPEMISRTATEWEGDSDEEYRARVRRTAISRVKPADMRRNARIVAENAKASK